MPTYEYKCTSCGNQYETKEGFDAPARQNCPRCGEVAKRMLFPPPIVFKGSGFYITDSRKGSSQVTVDSSTPSATSAATPPAKSDNGGSSNGESSSPAPAPAPSSTPSTNHDA